MSQFFADGQLIHMALDKFGLPGCFILDGQDYQVEGVSERWRVDEGWWQGRVWRDYYTLTTTNGGLMMVYYNLLAKTWHLARRYD